MMIIDQSRFSHTFTASFERNERECSRKARSRSKQQSAIQTTQATRVTNFARSQRSVQWSFIHATSAHSVLSVAYPQSNPNSTWRWTHHTSSLFCAFSTCHEQALSIYLHSSRMSSRVDMNPEEIRKGESEKTTTKTMEWPARFGLLITNNPVDDRLMFYRKVFLRFVRCQTRSKFSQMKIFSNSLNEAR